MSALFINLSDNRESYTPGDLLKGEAAWQLDDTPKKLFLRLFWFTRGKGTEDIEVVSEIVFDRPLSNETRAFEITLPQSPYSFAGTLVSLTWALELVTDDDQTAVTREIIMSPFGREIDLTAHSPDPS